MWTMLAGVPGKLKTLLDRLTADRATKLDNLNATITSRAQASTALSNTVWTPERAAKLDNITSDILNSPPNNTLISQNNKAWVESISPWWVGSSIDSEVAPTGAYRIDTAIATSAAVTTTPINLSGSGVIKALWFSLHNPGGTTGHYSATVVIDGVTHNTGVFVGAVGVSAVFPLIGGVGLHDNIVYKTSLSVTLNITTLSGSTAQRKLRCISLIHRV